jgi:hypothetical protein
MKPKFADLISWQQAELLMQPVFIRLLDNLRKQMEDSSWQGTYQNVMIWADDVPMDVREQVIALKQQLETADPSAAEGIAQQLKHLPEPSLGYKLHLKQDDQEVILDLWELCYQICFRNFSPPFQVAEDIPVEIDTTLMEADTGEVDWTKIDAKASQLVRQIFANLPAPNDPSPYFQTSSQKT